MSCYFRHIQNVFKEAGVEVTKANKREIDAAIHAAVGIEYKNCPAAWRALKALLAAPGGRRKVVEALRSPDVGTG